MNIDHLEAFMYVVQLKSIHKAADALFLSQPTVTARIKTLERELNTELFVRQGRGLLLTEHGREFIPYAEQIIQTYKEGKKIMKERAGHEEVIIGANTITSQYFIPFALPLWKQANPQLRFKFISAPNDILIEKLLQKQVDIAFIKDTNNEGLQKQQLLDNSVRLVVYPDHPLHYVENITANRLAEEQMVFFECGAFDWNRIHKLFEVGKVEPKIEFQVDHLEVAKSIIKNRCAIGFLPYLCIKNELARGELIEIDVAHLIQIKQHVFLTYTNQDVAKWPLWVDIARTVENFQAYQ
ncbi:LysR family transcriptional regulator [Psychrobacillus lasiicapitis]|uniref:LysR family transcriptional regulator n=1 Tax=Psychrobacillus lasiicapitis TaxID=1636719 RepID=A0A544SWZ9_9BACI|nr:LysR family transcriptional regulator [Psychrobacillus lasiicapitis]TQR09732.1 LysR family transcriptional regulator [Psychrobacillus lasiicapitis]GGA23062.1 LysR family transcriptional regulator [Psychrobacillus lasiicapitis]